MKPYTKGLSLALSLLMLAPVFASCAETAPDAGETAAGNVSGTDASSAETKAEESAFIPDDLPEANFDGYESNVLSCTFIGKDSGHLIMFEEITGDPVNDKLFASKCAVEDRFNVKIGMVDAVDASKSETVFRTSVAGGDHTFDLLVGTDIGTTILLKEGVNLNLRSVPQFNFDKPWWTKNAVEAFTIGDKMYSASSDLSYLGLHWTRAITVNKTLADNLNIEIPYETVREGKWTLDVLKSLIDGVGYDVDGNGKIDDRDQAGLSSGSQTWYCLQEAVGLSQYKKDENGIPYLDLDIERAQQYIDIMDSIINSTDYVESEMFGVKPFAAGNALFAFTQVGDAYDTFRLSDVKYGFLPTPKLDELQEEYVNCCTDMPWCMPKTLSGDNLTKAGTIIEALSCQNYNYVLPTYLEGALKSRIADEPDDSEMLSIIADTRTISFAYTFNMSFKDIVTDCVVGQSNVASYFKRGEKVAAKTLEKFIASIDAME